MCCSPLTNLQSYIDRPFIIIIISDGEMLLVIESLTLHLQDKCSSPAPWLIVFCRNIFAQMIVWFYLSLWYILSSWPHTETHFCFSLFPPYVLFLHGSAAPKNRWLKFHLFRSCLFSPLDCRLYVDDVHRGCWSTLFTDKSPTSRVKDRAQR